MVSSLGDWSREEVEAIVADYFSMLSRELQGEAINKAEHNRQIRKLLRARSRGSIEFKHANISAILAELGCPYVDGYKPRGNYQELLREVVADRLSTDRTLRREAERAADAVVDESAASEVGRRLVEVQAPARPEFFYRARERREEESVRPCAKVDYLAREERNSSIGRAGEMLVLEHERQRLFRADRPKLAEQIVHVAVEVGDSLGFDISSFEEDGSPRFIEVKTTQFGEFTPFFVSANEVRVSERERPRYRLYRVHKLRRDPRFFVLPGAIAENCSLEAVSYRALVGR